MPRFNRCARHNESVRKRKTSLKLKWPTLKSYSLHLLKRATQTRLANRLVPFANNHEATKGGYTNGTFLTVTLIN